MVHDAWREFLYVENVKPIVCRTIHKDCEMQITRWLVDTSIYTIW